MIGNVKESALPYLLEQLRLAKMSFDLFGALSPSDAKRQPPGAAAAADDNDKRNKNRNVSQAELESSLYKYDGTFADHLEMYIQLGYVVLFSSAFPLAALCALINNLVEIRTDAFKLCFIFQRPFGQRVPNIGTWQNAMDVMGLIAVLVNCALIGLSGQVHRMFPEMSTTQTILLIVALEHVMLILRLLVTCAIPDLPDWVATEMAKVEFARREAVRRLSTTATCTPPPSNATTPPPTITNIGRFVVSPTTADQEETAEKETIKLEVTEDDVRVSAEEDAVTAAEEDKEEGSTSVGEQTPPPRSASPSPSAPPSPIMATTNILTVGGGAGPAVVSAQERKKIRDWLPTTHSDALSHHLTIGPHGGVDWRAAVCAQLQVRRLNSDGGRKTSEPDMGASAVHRSTDCIVTQQKDLASASDSDLLRSAPPWLQSRFPFGSSHHATDSHRSGPSSRTSAAAGGDDSAVAKSGGGDLSLSDPTCDAAAAAAAKKSRVKQALIKRARSVAFFSLKLKERRANAASTSGSDKETPSKPVKEKPSPMRPPDLHVGGELSCIPIEKLISVEDISKQRRRAGDSSSNI